MCIELLAGEKQRNESSRAVQACNDYLRMGPSRSLRLLVAGYCSETEQNSAPTESIGTLMQWSDKYGWQKRAELYDVELENRKNERAADIMQTGLACPHERVVELKDLAAFLKGQLYEQSKGGTYHNIWLKDYKVLGSGEHAEVVEIERFNGAIISEYRATLDDLAKETGGRVKKIAPTDPTGTRAYDELSDEGRAARIAAIIDAARERGSGSTSSRDEQGSDVA